MHESAVRQQASGLGAVWDSAAREAVVDSSLEGNK